MTTLRTKATFTTLAALSLAGTLAGCATATTSGTTSSDASSSSSSSSSGTTASTYKDGTYSATASYQSPGGNENIDVTLTLKDSVITAVKSTVDGTDPDELHYQGEFDKGIAAVVVGKKLDDIQVDKVGGSSLTSEGFNNAVEKIKTSAKA